MKDCKITSDEKKKTLLEAHRAFKKEKKNFQGTRVPALLDNQTASAGLHLSLQSRVHHRLAPSSWHTIVKFLGDNGHFLPTFLPTNGRSFKAVDCTRLRLLGKSRSVRSSTLLPDPADFATLRPTSCRATRRPLPTGASCSGEIILDNPFLVHSGLNVTDFIAENIYRLSSLDYGNLHGDHAPTKVGGAGRETSHRRCRAYAATPLALGFSAAAPRFCPMIANGDLPLVDGDYIE